MDSCFAFEVDDLIDSEELCKVNGEALDSLFIGEHVLMLSVA